MFLPPAGGVAPPTAGSDGTLRCWGRLLRCVGGVFSSSAAELAALGAVNGGAHAVPHAASLADTTRTQQLAWSALSLGGLLQLPPAGGVAPQTGE